MDRYEAPNREGALPLVMYNYIEAQAWCEARGKRLCYDDDWTQICGGPEGYHYPYGNTYQPGICNDEEVWRTYVQSKLNGWPSGVSTPVVDSLAQLLADAAAASAGGAVASEHVEGLYQGEPSGINTGCTNGYGAFDLSGNVEEWTTRRNGATTDFHGNLKGRYWSETRTCQSNITTHGDHFRFYEIGFRCCRDIYR